MFMGYSLQELASIVAIIGVVVSSVMGAYRMATSPLIRSINELNDTFKHTNEETVNKFKSVDKRLDHQWARIEKHEQLLGRHDERLKTLFNDGKKDK